MLDRLWLRLGAACGILYIVLSILGHEVLGGGGEAPIAGAPRAQITSYFANNPPTAQTWMGVYIELVGLVLFVFFLGSLYGVLRRAEGEGGWLSAVAFGGGLLSVAVKLASAPAVIAAYYRASEGLDPQLAAALVDMNNASFVVTWATNAVLLAATAIVVIGTGALPRWVGWMAAVLSAGLLVGAAVPTSGGAFLPMLLFMIWILATSVVLIRRAGGPSRSQVAAAPAAPYAAS